MEVTRKHTVLHQVNSGVSDSLQPFGLGPTKLLCPWDFSGKNTGVGCHLFPPPGDLQDPGIEAKSLTSPALAGGFFATSIAWEALVPSLEGKTYFMLSNYFECTKKFVGS